jgi:hypothetical protein
LRELAGIGQRLAVFAEHLEVLRRFDGRGLDDRDRFAVSGERPQRPRVFDRNRLLAGIAVVTPARLIGVSPELRLVRRLGRRAIDGAGDVAEVVAAGQRRADRRERSDEQSAQEDGAGGQSRHRGPGDEQKQRQRESNPNLAPGCPSRSNISHPS